MRTRPYFRLAINVLIGILVGLAISQVLSACSDELPLAPVPSAGIAGEAPLETALAADAPTTDEPVATADLLAVNLVPAARVAPATNTAKAPVSVAMPLPQSTERYHLSWDGKLEGDATRSLSCEKNTCRYETKASVIGLASLTEISDFQWLNSQVQLQRYERTLQLLFKQIVRIEKQPDGSIRSERRGKKYSYASQPNLVDILNIEVQLRADRLAGRAPKASYPLADSKGISAISLHREPNETLNLLGKARPCEVYVRKDSKRTTTLWLDPAQAFLPLQIVHQDGPETYRMVWTGAAK